MSEARTVDARKIVVNRREYLMSEPDLIKLVGEAQDAVKPTVRGYREWTEPVLFGMPTRSSAQGYLLSCLRDRLGCYTGNFPTSRNHRGR
jgi:hypothetical protein